MDVARPTLHVGEGWGAFSMAAAITAATADESALGQACRDAAQDAGVDHDEGSQMGSMAEFQGVSGNAVEGVRIEFAAQQRRQPSIAGFRNKTLGVDLGSNAAPTHLPIRGGSPRIDKFLCGE